MFPDHILNDDFDVFWGKLIQTTINNMLDFFDQNAGEVTAGFTVCALGR